MKKLIISICAFLFLLLSVWNSQAWIIDDLFESWTNAELVYCQDNDCTIENAVEELWEIDAFITDKKASEYVQSVIVYVLGFIALISVVYIIYAGFNIVISAWDDEKMTKSKNTIMYVVIGLIVIFLAYSIVAFIFDVFDQSEPTQAQTIVYEIA